MNCPNCNETLVMTERQGVEIDYCPKCRGVWLDRGELDKIIERSGAMDGDRNERLDEDADDYRRKSTDPGYARRKKRGFFGDLFDFD